MDEKGFYKFPKEERLHHRSLLEGLFRHGKSFYEFPFRVTWRIISEEELKKNFRNNPPEDIGRVQLMISVPKKKRKRAVDRVQMRRRIREAYRLNRLPLKDYVIANGGIKTLSIGIVYIYDKNLPYISIEDKMKTLLSKLQAKIHTKESC